jgi:hypothetical protein
LEQAPTIAYCKLPGPGITGAARGHVDTSIEWLARLNGHFAMLQRVRDRTPVEQGQCLLALNSSSAGTEASSSDSKDGDVSQMRCWNRTTSFSSTEGTNPSTASKSYNWICNGTVDCANSIADVRDIIIRKPKEKPFPIPGHWYVNSQQVQYCLNEPAISHYRLHYDRIVGTIATLLNFCK